MLYKSKYNLEIIPSLGNLIIFNTFSGEIVELDDNEILAWEAENYHDLQNETIQYLISKGILVEDKEEQLHSVVEAVKKVQSSQSNFFYRIMVTTDCNARCSYCFQNGINKERMSTNVADDVVNFITNTSKRGKKVGLGWFGGEPLLEQKTIEYIWDKLLKNNPDKHFYSNIITNGSLITDDTIRLFKKINVKTIQITLDGLFSYYDDIKRYVSKRYTFSTILDNIRLLISNGIRPTIRINYNVNNVPEALSSIDFLYNTFGNSIKVYCSELFTITSNVTNQTVSTLCEGILLKKLIQCHYVAPIKYLKRRKCNCGFSSFDSFMIIQPNGSIIKCCESYQHPELSLIGSIYTDLDVDKVNKWKQITNKEECLNCVYFPLCLGGCKASQFGITSNRCFKYKRQIESIVLMTISDVNNCSKS